MTAVDSTRRTLPCLAVQYSVKFPFPADVVWPLLVISPSCYHSNPYHCHYGKSTFSSRKSYQPPKMADDRSSAHIFVEDSANFVRKDSKAHIVLNSKLRTDCVDVSPDDTSFRAQYVRFMAPKVGRMFTPRKMIAILRILKALTFFFIVLDVLADIVYISVVEAKSGQETQAKLGGHRDLVVRAFAVFVAIIVALIELDHARVKEHFSGFKPFLTRSILIIFVSILTNTPPIIAYERRSNAASSSSSSYSYNNGYSSSSSAKTTTLISDEVPKGVITFQSVSAWMT